MNPPVPLPNLFVACDIIAKNSSLVLITIEYSKHFCNKFCLEEYPEIVRDFPITWGSLLFSKQSGQHYISPAESRFLFLESNMALLFYSCPCILAFPLVSCNILSCNGHFIEKSIHPGYQKMNRAFGFVQTISAQLDNSKAVDKCSEKPSRVLYSPGKKLSLSVVLGSLTILMIGLYFTVCVFLLEVMTSWLSKIKISINSA